jgi:AraC-like DNA-binding protein
MITEVLLLNPVYVTLFWAIVLKIQSGNGNEPKRFLGTMMIAAFVVYLSHLFYFTGNHDIYIWLDSFYSLASQSIYPLYFIYVLLLTRDKNFSLRLHGGYLLIPAAVFLMTAIGYLIMDNATEELYVTRVMYGRDADGRGIDYMKGVSFIARILLIVQVLVYVYLSYRKIRYHNRNIDDYFSAPELRNLKWVQVFNIVLFVASLASITVAALGRQRFEGNDLYLLIPSLIFSVVLFMVGLLGNMQKAAHVREPEALYVTPAEEKDHDKLVEDLLALFEKEQLYLNKDLKIWDITGLLATNRTYVSRIINNEFGLNFCAFVNRYRVENAKKLLASPKRYSIEDIADRSGFGSVNSLYRAFVVAEKMPLSEYRNKIRNKGSANQGLA